jgi:DNA replication protein DnaC
VALSTGLNPVERKITFANIETDGRPGAAKMLKAAQEFMQNGRNGFLTIHGDFGNGKTTVLKAIVNECVMKGISARYITMTEVMNYAREAFESLKAGDTDYGRITELAKVPVLVIDELDKARVTEYAREVQTHLFDMRYRNSHALGTVVAWNGAFEDIELPWVRSRLSQFVVVENADKDMRPLLGGNE